MARMYSLLAAFVAAAAIAAEPSRYEPVRLGETELRHYRWQADRFAARSGIAALTEDSRNEVRIWHSISAIVPGIRLETWSYVIAPAHVLECKITYSQGGGTSSHDPCSVIGHAPQVQALSALVDALLPYADSRTGCGIQDGDHYTVDVTRDGRRFVIASTNPDVCKDEGSAAVAALIEAMRRLQR